MLLSNEISANVELFDCSINTYLFFTISFSWRVSRMYVAIISRIHPSATATRMISPIKFRLNRGNFTFVHSFKFENIFLTQTHALSHNQSNIASYLFAENIYLNSVEKNEKDIETYTRYNGFFWVILGKCPWTIMHNACKIVGNIELFDRGIII